MLGSNNSNNINYGLDFSSGQADTFSLFREMNVSYTNASICDTNGQILFYTNGVYIANKDNDTLSNSLNFNPGFFTSHFYNDGIPIFQGAITIPFPGSTDKYYIFHESAEVIQLNSQQASHPLNLAYSVVDMNLDGGLGGLSPLKKAIHIIDDTLTLGRITAVKHANGRDWWVLCHRYISNTFFKILVSPSGAAIFSTQDIGDTIPFRSYYGFAMFSPDGKTFLFQINDSTINVFDFDRCTGILSNPISLNVSYLNYSICGTAISLNSRFLYVCNNYFLHQFDLFSPSIPTSDIVIAQWDSFVAPLSTYFFTMQLAPDNKIYMGTYYGSHILHIIHNPDSLGISCNFVQNSFTTPANTTWGFPNSPNYDLGKISNSICDSLSIDLDEEPALFNLQLFPNPFTSIVSLNGDLLYPLSYSIYDLSGRMVVEKEKLLYSHIKLDFLAKGMYVLNIKDRNERIYNLKLVKE